jgi:hypothetical protein
METIQWEHYPYVAENSHARTWLEMQVKLCLADNTIKAYGRSANDYLAFCQRARIAFVEATKADIVLYIDDMLQRSNPRGENICYLHSGVGLANATLAASPMAEAATAAVFRRMKLALILPMNVRAPKPTTRCAASIRKSQITSQDHLLRDAKDWHDQRVDDTYGPQPSQSTGENRHHGQDQQYEGNDEAEQHMDAGEVRVSIRTHPKRHGHQRSNRGDNLEKTCSIHGKVLPFFYTTRATRPSLPGGRLVKTKRSGISAGAGACAISFPTQTADG